jgi:hypothetical protein
MCKVWLLYERNLKVVTLLSVSRCNIVHNFLLLPRATTAMKEISQDLTCFYGGTYNLYPPSSKTAMF